MNLWQRLAEPGPKPAQVISWAGDRFVETDWAARARSAAAQVSGLRSLGVSSGTRVACVLTNGPSVPPALLAIWLAGGVVVSLPIPSRAMQLGEYLEQLRALCRRAEADLLLVERRFLEPLAGVGDGALRVVAYEDVPADAGPATAAPPEADEVALIQFSSGSTDHPKGCILTTAAIAFQIEALAAVLEIDPSSDRGVMWLPLSHDMGLIGGLLLVWASNMPGLGSTPERFLTAPHTWLDDCANFAATLTLGPDFALRVAEKAARRRLPPRPIRLRAVVVGGERIHLSTLDQVADTLGPVGLTRDVFRPAYGLAEATLGVTVAPRTASPDFFEVGAEALLAGELSLQPDGDAGSVPIVSAGRPLPGVEVRVAGEAEIGELWVRSPSLADGYLGDPSRTAATFVDGELRTGDLGFVHDGALFLIGRTDDVLAVYGRNVHATELESRFERDPAVRAGCSAIVDVFDGHHTNLVVLAEQAEEQLDLSQAARRLGATATSAAGLAVRECIFLRRGALPKTPSGKVQRFRCRELAAEPEPADMVARIPLRRAVR